MERLVRVDPKNIDKYNPDRFGVQQVFKIFSEANEYQIGGVWIAGNPVGKPEAKRVVFDLEKLRAARDTYFIWDEISKIRACDPVFPEKIIERVAITRMSGEPLNLFIPWGVRPEGQPKYEQQVLDRIKTFQDSLKLRNVNAKVLLMPADLYATEVNNIDMKLTDDYFRLIGNLACDRSFEVKSWSQIRTENKETYKRRAGELTPKVIQQTIGIGKVLDAIDTARRRSGYTLRKQIENAAYAYLRERVCEAEIVESIYRPIKLSMVTKNKDNIVDRDLPRVYIIPTELQFPWLQ